jgi:hypothetical protein
MTGWEGLCWRRYLFSEDPWRYETLTKEDVEPYYRRRAAFVNSVPGGIFHGAIDVKREVLYVVYILLQSYNRI